MRNGRGVAFGGAVGAGGPAFAALRDRAAAWAEGRSWLVRLPLLLWFIHIFRLHLADPFYTSIFGGLNLGLHELGHFVFLPLGEIASIAGGTLLQCLAPVIAAAMFYRQEDYFGIAVAWCWLSTNLFHVALYAGDARGQRLPLVSPGAGDPIHDWHYLLEAIGLLAHDRAVADTFRLAAALSMLIGLGTGGWLLWRMFRSTAGRDGRPGEVR